MDIRHLRTFLKVVEHGNVTAAAADLGISQPALSKLLSRLEDELGVALLERLPRGVKPSPQGEILGHYAQGIDAQYRSALRQISAAHNAEVGEVTIGAGYFWLQGLLPLAVAEVTAQFPGASIKIVAGVPEDLIKMLLAGRLDMVLGPVGLAVPYPDEIVLESLIRTNTHVLVRTGHPVANGARKSVADLLALDWALPAGTYVRKRFDQLFEFHGLVPPQPRIEINDVQATLDIVARSDFATLATSFTPAGGLREGLECLDCPEIDEVRETGILLFAKGMRQGLSQRFITALRAVSRKHPHAIHPVPDAHDPPKV